MRLQLVLALFLLSIATGSAQTSYINTIGPKNQSLGNNFNIFIDNTNNRVGIGSSTPLATLEINGSGTSWPGLLVSNRSAPIFYVNTSSGNIGIGTQNATQKVTINDGGLLQGYGNFTPRVVGGIGFPEPGPYVGRDMYNSIVISGKYAYVPVGSDAGGGKGLKILDISNPQNILMAGSTDPFGTCCNIFSLAVSGKYAYSGMGITDISNVSNPTFVNTLGTIQDSSAFSIAVSGKYLYLGGSVSSNACSGISISGCEFSIFDISDPRNIRNISGINIDRNIYSLFVSGNYAYLGIPSGGVGCSASCSFRIIDITDPANPKNVSGVDLLQNTYYVFASGGYVYALNEPTGGVHDFVIINVTNPNNPINISSVDIPGITEIFGFSLSGKYAYITVGNNSGNEMRIYDVSNVFSPVEVGGAELGNTTLAITVSGKYAYTVSRNYTVPCTGSNGFVGCEFKVWDLGGIDAPAASIGNIAANTLDVSETARAGNLIVGSSLSVGANGIYSQGALGIFANGPNALDVKTSTGVQLLLAQNNRTLGIGTSQPGSNLHVNGSGQSFSGLLVSNGTNNNIFYVNSTSGSVGIGTQNATQKVTINDGGLLQGYGNFTPRVVGGIAVPGNRPYVDYDIKNLVVSGKYAYVPVGGNSGGDKRLLILDISNPQGISQVSLTPAGSDCCTIDTVAVSGKYAYTVEDALTITDISNASSPVTVSSKTITLDTSVYTLAVSGKYVYTGSFGYGSGTCTNADPSSCEFAIYDISDPANIKNVSGIDFFGSSVNNIFLSGKYAYLGTNPDGGSCSSARIYGCSFVIVDVSDPANPKNISHINVGQAAYNIYVSGSYAYVVGDAATGVNDFVIINVTNPNSPVNITSIDIPGVSSLYSISVNGKYAYITTDNNSGNEMRIYDISNVLNPVEVGGAELGNTTLAIAISGRYAYTVSRNYTVPCTGSNGYVGCEFKVWDIGGLDAPGASIGNIAANTLDVSETGRVNNLIVGTGLSVGANGIYSQGPLGIFANGPNSLDVKTSTGVQLLLAQNNMTIGIGTSQPGSNLHVNGSGASWAGLLVSNGTNNMFYVNSTSGNVAIGSRNASQRLTIQDGGLLQGYGSFTPRVVGGLGDIIPSLYVGRDSLKPMAIVGKYLYLGTGANTGGSKKLIVIDISNPQRPLIAGTWPGTSGLTINTVFASGKYVYTAEDAGRMSIIDVSNASSPVLINYILSNGANYVFGVYVSGKYAYTTGFVSGDTCSGTQTVGCEFSIQDISNPNDIRNVSGVDILKSAIAVFVSGRYAYVGTSYDAGYGVCSGSNMNACTLNIFDVIDPANPVFVNGVNLSALTSFIRVSEPYAYALSGPVGTTRDFAIINISNPNSPNILSSVDIPEASEIWGLEIAGKYAFVTLGNNSGNELRIYDISNALNPVEVGGVELGNTTLGIAISGKYAYTVSRDFTGTCSNNNLASCEFKVWDLGGIDAPAASIGNIATNTLDVSESARTGSLVVGSSLAVGPGGIYSQGPISILSSPTSALLALDVKNAGGQLLFNVQNSGGVGINTTPINGALLQINSSGGALIYRNNGNLGIIKGASVILPTNLLTLRGTTSSTLLNITDGTITYGVYLGLLSSDKTLNFIDTTDTDWNAGTHAGTAVEGSGGIANLTNTSGTKAGTFQSQIFNGGRNTGWRSMRVSSEANYDTEIGRANGDITDGILPGINTTGLVLLYHFNNESGLGENDTLYRDFSIDVNSGKSANNGTCSGTACPVYNFSNKQLGRGSIEFDGTDDHVDVRKINVDTTPGRRNTVAFWMYWTGDGNGGTGREPIGWGETDTSTHYELWMNSSPNCLGFNTHSWDCWGVPTTGLENRWVHFVAIFHNGPTSQSQIYIDGINRTLSGPSGTQTISENLTIGGASGGDGSFPFQGRIDEIAVWNRSLTPGEIQNLYLRGTIRLNISARVCDDPACSGDAFQLIPNITDGYAHALNLTANMQYFQYNVSFINATQNHTTFRINDVTTGFLSETGASIGTMTNHTLRLYTNNTDRLEIDINGNVGINVMNPTQKLTVNGAGNFTSNLTIGSQSGTGFNVSGITMYNQSNRAWCLRVTGEGTLQAVPGSCG